MGWFVVSIIVPIFSTLSCLFVMKLLPVDPEYKKKAEVLRAVRDGQMGWIVVGISSSLLYEASSLKEPTYWFVGLSIVAIFFNALVSGFGIMFPYKEADIPKKDSHWFTKVCSYPVLSFNVLSLIAVCALYALHHFFLVPPACEACVAPRG